MSASFADTVPVPAAVEGGAPAAPPPPAVELGAFSNQNLLKVDCRDGFSMVSAIKKKIQQAFPRPSPDAPLLPGLVRISKAPKSTYVFMAFASEADREAAAAKLETIVHRGKNWARADVTAHDLSITHSGGSVQDAAAAKRPRDAADKQPREGGGARREGAGASVAPWAHLSYEEQIRRKTQHCERVLADICKHQKKHRKDFSFLNNFHGVRRSPQTVQYRNHVNFTCGYDAAGRPCIGFNEGALVSGVASVLPASSDAILATTHKVAQFVAMRIEELASRSFPMLTMMDKRRLCSSGFWRRVQVRHSVDCEVMVDVEVDIASVSVAVLRDVADALRVALCTPAAAAAACAHVGDGSERWRVVSLQYHAGRGSSQQADGPRTVIFGTPTLREMVCGRRFELSPTAFFQVNTLGMEEMMGAVRSSARLTPSTILLDLCCGTGTIGLCFARDVRRVIGIEMVADAVENARVNAAANGATNVEYHAAKLEDALADILRRLLSEGGAGAPPPHIVGILDPPRSGLHPSVVRHLRATEVIEELVYISCDQSALVRDAEGLTKPASNSFRGEPFRVSSAFGVDLFPNSHHVEFVAVFKRGAAAAALVTTTANVADNVKAAEEGDAVADSGGGDADADAVVDADEN